MPGNLPAIIKPNAVDRLIGYFSPARGLRRAHARQMTAYTDYKAADINRLRSGWALGMTGATPARSSLNLLRERSRDAVRNDPSASAAVDVYKHNVIGSGLQPQSKISAELLGISDDHAAELQKQAEAAFRRWSPHADAGNRLSFDEMQIVALGKIVEDGDLIVNPTWANDSFRHYGRCLELIEADRLATPLDKLKEKTVVDGVELGTRNQPKAYYLKKTLASTSLRDFKRVPAHDRQGRPKVLHIYPTKRPGQVRGVPLFAPVLTYFKDLADYLEAEIVNMRVAACLAVFITKTDPMSAAMAHANDNEPTTNARIQELEPGLIGYLNPDESIETVDPKRPGNTFQPFVETTLRLIGASLGIPYEVLVKDFSKTNYSSARAALLEGRRTFTTWRTWFASKFCQPIWNLVIEEAYLRGEFDAPHFYENQFLYSDARWIGGAWGWVDPVKEVEASRKAIDYGLSTLAKETAAQGDNWEDNIDQLGREKQKIDAAGVKVLTSQPQTEGGSGNEPDGQND